MSASKDFNNNSFSLSYPILSFMKALLVSLLLIKEVIAFTTSMNKLGNLFLRFSFSTTSIKYLKALISRNSLSVFALFLMMMWMPLISSNSNSKWVGSEPF